MENKKLSHIITETEKQKEKENGRGCKLCNKELDIEDDKRVHGDTTLWIGIYCSPQCYTKTVFEKPIKLLELNIIIRAGSIDDIIGLIPKVTGDFVCGNKKIGSWCGVSSNYEFKLSEK